MVQVTKYCCNQPRAQKYRKVRSSYLWISQIAARYHGYRPYYISEPVEQAKAAAEHKDFNCNQDYLEPQMIFR